MSGEVVRASDAERYMEGPEYCREYLRTELMWFGTSVVPPGATGGTDAGHARSTEVFFCAQGRAVVDVDGSPHALNAGDAVIIPPGSPHTISNVGTEPVLIVWAGAPGE